MLDNLPLLEELGFSCEDFGGGAVLVRQCPDYVDAGDVEATLLELAGTLAEGGRADPDGARDALMATMSCKAAVKGNNRLSFQEAEKLIDELLTLDNPYNCPHGRPTIITMTETDLEKKFKRIV